MNRLLKLTMKTEVLEVNEKFLKVKTQNYMKETASSLNKKNVPYSATTNKTITRKSSFNSAYMNSSTIKSPSKRNSNCCPTTPNKSLSKKNSFSRCSNNYLDPYGHFNDIVNVNDPYGHFN